MAKTDTARVEAEPGARAARELRARSAAARRADARAEETMAGVMRRTRIPVPRACGSEVPSAWVPSVGCRGAKEEGFALAFFSVLARHSLILH